MWTADQEINLKAIFAVMDTTYAEQPEKISDL